MSAQANKELYERLLEAGYTHLLPIIPRDAVLSVHSKLDPDKLGKIPGKQISDGWCGFKSWTKFEATQEDIDDWCHWQEHPVGTRADRFPGIDIDIDDPALVEEINNVINAHMPETAIRTREGSVRTIRSYRLSDADEPIALQRVIFEVDGSPAGMVEILGAGRHYVLAGEHKSGAMQELHGIPAEVTRAQIDELVNALKEISGFVESKECKSKGASSEVRRIVKTQCEIGPMSYDTRVGIIKSWRQESGRHDVLRDIIFMKSKLGLDVAIKDAVDLMNCVPMDKRDARWYEEFNDIQRLSNGAETRLSYDIYIPEPSVEIEIPDFPALRLPDPLQFQHEQFRAVAFDPHDDLMYPFESAFSGYILNGRVLTPLRGRMPTLLNIGLGASTAGKDLNSTDILIKFPHQKYTTQIAEEVFNMVDTPGIITSDTSLLEELHEKRRLRGLFWLVTEASDNMRRLCSNTSNDSVLALGRMLKHNYDGQHLPSNVKVKSKDSKPVPGKEFANLFIAWYVQPELFFPSLTTEMLADGFAGRIDYTYYMHSGQIISMFGAGCTSVDEFDPMYMEYFTYVFQKCTHDGIFRSRVRIQPFVSAELRDWEMSLARDDKDLQKFIRRIPMSAEKHLTIWAAHQHLWECFHSGKEPWKEPISIPREFVSNIMPWCEYQLKLRENVIYGRIGESMWKRREDYVIKVITDAINDPRKVESHAGQELAKKGRVSRRHIFNYMKEKTSLKLDNPAERLKLLDAMVKEGRLIKDETPIPWYALRREE